MKQPQLEVLMSQLNYTFKNTALLEVALTHSSYANENQSKGIPSNERLEFLGDAVLGVTVSKLLYDSAANLPEGRMTKLRAELVCEASLTSIAHKLDLGQYIKLGKGEEKGGGRKRPSILADAVEAVIAAIYLDGGFAPAAQLIERFLSVDSNQFLQKNTDYKTALQELIQVNPGQLISYQIKGESGPDHMKVFTVEVLLNDVTIGLGEGKSKKLAEQMAAKAALLKMHEHS
ncbi:MAG: ribonuclease III [Oscillospiraceae bacterium]|nr:ribonuclease III [Oscillospiraceae bacterium]